MIRVKKIPISLIVAFGHSIPYAQSSSLPTAEEFVIEPARPDQICSSYNANIELAKAWYDSQGIDSSFFDNKLCEYIELYPGEDEYELELSSHGEGLQVGNTAYTTERMDVKNKVALLMFSDTTYTYFQLYSDANVTLKSQKNSEGNSVTTKTGHDLSLYPFMSFFEGSYIKNYVGQSSASRSCLGIKPVDADPNCIPGGETNSRYWSLRDTYPGTSYSTRVYDVSNTEEVGFSMTANPNGELSVNYSTSSSESLGTQNDAFVSNQVNYENDIGFFTEFSVDRTILESIIHPVGTNADFQDTASSNEAVGETAWKELDLSSVTTWSQVNNQETCSSNMRITFVNELGVARSIMGLDPSSYKAETADIGIKIATRNPSTLEINTVCEELGNGQYHRKLAPLSSDNPEKTSAGYQNTFPVSSGVVEELETAGYSFARIYNNSIHCPLEWSNTFINDDERLAKYDCNSSGDLMILRLEPGTLEESSVARFTAKIEDADNSCKLEWAGGDEKTLEGADFVNLGGLANESRLRVAKFDCASSGDRFIFEEVEGEENIYTIEAEAKRGCYLTTSSGIATHEYPLRNSNEGRGWVTDYNQENYYHFLPMTESKHVNNVSGGWELFGGETRAYFDCTPNRDKDTFYVSF
ncbi:hypothetical protein BA953_15600 [Vibrio coralliilyticus]|uniref:hypothetical protein n=1 Tax=Vibrio coralliilyticus TaxID=190893 RepID=UPI0008106A57|nr:hypothetical protein [Vibrio coralliilyticus]ANW25510.1 hypothetical protein BA953_15600 [Vibrio coralliilyticus]